MSKHFRDWKIDETQLLPASVQDYVPEGHLSRFIVALVRESLDLAEIEASYAGNLGQPPFHRLPALAGGSGDALDQIGHHRAAFVQVRPKSSLRISTAPQCMLEALAQIRRRPFRPS